MKIGSRHVIPALVLAMHLAADASFLLSFAPNYQSWVTSSWAGLGFALLGLPAAQGGLVAIWAAMSTMRPVLRFPLAVAGTAAPAFVFAGVFRMDASHPVVPAFAFALVTQLLTVLLFIGGGRFFRRQLRRWRAGWKETDTESTQFGIRQLLLGTAVSAAALGLGRAVFAWCGWSARIFSYPPFFILQILAVCGALCVLIVLGLFTVRVRWPVRTLLFPLVVLASAAVTWLALVAMLKSPAGVTSGDIPILGTVMIPQVVYHTLTLWPLWLCGCIGQQESDGSCPPETPIAPPDASGR